MKIVLKVAVLSTLLSFGSGCIIHGGRTVHYRAPRPAPQAQVVVVKPQPARQPQVVVVNKPQPAPRTTVIVVNAPAERPSSSQPLGGNPIHSQPPAAPTQQPTAAERPASEPIVNVIISRDERLVLREWINSKKNSRPKSDTANNDNHGKNDTHGKKNNDGKAKATNTKAVPPGLAKKVAQGDGLPPGWQKKVAKGQIIQPEVYRRCQHLPAEVIVRLPPAPPGTILVTIEGKVVRLAQATLEILDVFEVL